MRVILLTQADCYHVANFLNHLAYFCVFGRSIISGFQRKSGKVSVSVHGSQADQRPRISLIFTWYYLPAQGHKEADFVMQLG